MSAQRENVSQSVAGADDDRLSIVDYGSTPARDKQTNVKSRSSRHRFTPTANHQLFADHEKIEQTFSKVVEQCAAQCLLDTGKTAKIPEDRVPSVPPAVTWIGRRDQSGGQCQGQALADPQPGNVRYAA